ncbi:hypothetical protein ABA45_08930 [Marinobacter psychrophilus]|uniref:Uncharacterized protein n=1 Tax=Marinobacter psychrophilus TaxID=330734 RepID=A0A0H4I496_9GAMM|nr:hypothetical protein [Marinobacter psychrophilus]AKO52525.1 hypothetical protein ABA45_08930 [Marinobacter psychrophilus]
MIATKEEFQQALLKLRDKSRFRNTKYLDLLKAQYSSPNHTITATKLAQAVGYENYNAANLQYGSLGHELAEVLGYKPPERNNGEPMWFWTISTGSEAESDSAGHYEFAMRLELVQALEGMKWVK